MICPSCKYEIDNDSFYCDQCGIEIMICPKCGKPGKGKICTSDGTRLIAASQKEQVASPAPAPSRPVEDTIKPAPSSVPAAPVSIPIPAADSITLTNKAVNISFSPKDGDIIGRRQGPFVNIFSQYNQISGQHARISFDQSKGWMITDLGSSNGTKYMNIQLQPNVPQPIQSGQYLILANIEFFIQINTAVSDNSEKTVRI